MSGIIEEIAEKQRNLDRERIRPATQQRIKDDIRELEGRKKNIRR